MDWVERVPYRLWAYALLMLVWFPLLAVWGNSADGIVIGVAVTAGVIAGRRFAWGVAVTFHAYMAGIVGFVGIVDWLVVFKPGTLAILALQGAALVLLTSDPVQAYTRAPRAPAAVNP